MKIQEIRKKKGLSQAELAERSGISVRTLQGYEIGRRSIDSANIDTIVAIADALEVPLFDIVEDKVRSERIKKNLKQ